MVEQMERDENMDPNIDVEEAKNLASELAEMESKYNEIDERNKLSEEEIKLLYEGTTHSKIGYSKLYEALGVFRRLEELRAKNGESKQKNA